MLLWFTLKMRNCAAVRAAVDCFLKKTHSHAQTEHLCIDWLCRQGYLAYSWGWQRWRWTANHSLRNPAGNGLPSLLWLTLWEERNERSQEEIWINPGVFAACIGSEYTVIYCFCTIENLHEQYTYIYDEIGSLVFFLSLQAEECIHSRGCGVSRDLPSRPPSEALMREASQSSCCAGCLWITAAHQ